MSIDLIGKGVIQFAATAFLSLIGLLLWQLGQLRSSHGATGEISKSGLGFLQTKLMGVLVVFAGALGTAIADMPGPTRLVVSVFLLAHGWVTLLGTPRPGMIQSTAIVLLVPVVAHVLGWAYLVPLFLPPIKPVPQHPGSFLTGIFGPSVGGSAPTLARQTEIAFYRLDAGLTLESSWRGGLTRLLIYSPMVLVNPAAYCAGMVAGVLEPPRPGPSGPAAETVAFSQLLDSVT